MSRSLSSAFVRLSFFLGLALALGTGISPAHAQFSSGGINPGTGGSGGVSGGTGNGSDTKYVYKLEGTDALVDANGGSATAPEACPFELVNGSGAGLYEAARDAAVKAGEPNECPFFVGRWNKRRFLKKCENFYYNASVSSGKSAHPNKNIICCHLPPGNKRQMCLQDYAAVKVASDASAGSAMVATNTLGDALTTQQRRDIEEKKKAQAEQEKSCFGDALKNVNKFWAEKQEVKCLNAVTDIFAEQKAQIIDFAASKGGEILANSFKGMSMWGILDAWSVGAGATGIAKEGVLKSTKLSRLVSRMKKAIEGCRGVIPQLDQIANFQKSIMENLSCKALSNLLERQLTQCIRVNFSTSGLTLPYFSLQLQCPINININASIGNDGFRCFSNVSVGSPIQGSFGRYSTNSLLSGNGGMANIFNPNCFGKSSSSNNTSGGVSNYRVPGYDCGPLDKNNVLKNEPITGKKYLAAGTGTNGWVVGASEQIMQPRTSNGTIQYDAEGNAIMEATGLTVTRCDMMKDGASILTNYVYGSGTSCNDGTSGYLDGGNETNSACYPGGGYTPAPLPNAPDACLYPVACLDSSGNFSAARAGTNNCPKNVQPIFDASRTYTVFSGGGLNGGGAGTAQSCEAFSGEAKQAVLCCNPQMEDCRNADADRPLCACDSGGANNKVITSDGQCELGGNATCCSPRLNGAEWCRMKQTESNGQVKVCADEIADQCLASNETGVYVAPDGSTKQMDFGTIVASKPSPYMYLFVRPDTAVAGQQCCMTEWCNICPQHYANAYGLSMVRSDNYVVGSKPVGDVADSNLDRHNNSLLGRGWPFTTSTDVNGGTTYAVGISPLSVKVKFDQFIGSDTRVLSIRNPVLYLSPDITLPLTDTLNACNNLSAWRTAIGSSQMFDQSMDRMAYAYTPDTGEKDKWARIGAVPMMQEMPLTYLNRIRMAQTVNGNPLQPIPLCSEVAKVCTPGSLGSLAPSVPSNNFTGGGLSGGTTTTIPQPVAAPTPTPAATQQPAAAAPVARSTAPATTRTTTTPGATSVPSAGSGQASGNLY